MSSRTIALIAIVAASLLWSTAGIAKVVVRAFDPYTAAFIRFFIASLVILPFFLKEKRSKHILHDLVPVALMGSANIFFFYLGLQTSTANAATIIYAGVPLITMIMAKRAIGEHATGQKIFGIFLGLLGVILVALLPIFEKGEIISGDIRGNIFFLAAIFSWSLYNVGSRRAIAKQQYSPMTVSAISIFTTAVLFAPITLVTFQSSYVSLLREPQFSMIFLHLGILLTVATLLLYQIAVKHSSATTVSLTTYFQTIFAIAFNILFLGEKLTSGFIIGSIIVLVGVFFTSGKGLWKEIKSWIH